MATPKQYDIFISYRREGGKNYARILKPELEKRGFQERVFLDFDELKDGKFDKRIMDAIDSAPIFIIILSDGCLDRCINENDWVRQEILHALASNKHIIPVVCDKTFKDFPTNIPEVIRKGLGQHQFSQIDTDTLLRASVNELVEFRISPIINRTMGSSKFTKSSPNIDSIEDLGAEIHIITDADCNILRFRKQIGTAKMDEDNIIRLVKGNHLLDFVSVEYSDIKCTQKYKVPDNIDYSDYSDFIEVELNKYIIERKKHLDVQERENKEKETTIANIILSLKENAKKLNRKKKLQKREQMNLIPFKSGNGKYGFRNEDNNSIVISAKYNYAREFNDLGLALVMNDDYLYGFINRIEEFVIPYKWEDAGDFSEGLAKVKDENDKYGFIDRTGKVVLPCKWKYVSSFYKGQAVVEDDSANYWIIDKIGMVLRKADRKELRWW